jgi:hypothetical protein
MWHYPVSAVFVLPAVLSNQRRLYWLIVCTHHQLESEILQPQLLPQCTAAGGVTRP